MVTEKSLTKRLIKDALIELMSEKSFLDITVTDLTKKAGVARVSFYRNYDSINTVIDEITDDWTLNYIEEIYPVLQNKDERKWRDFLFNYFYQFPKNTHRKSNNPYPNADVWLSRINNKIQQEEKKYVHNSLSDKYASVGKMGLINNIIQNWFFDGMIETPEEMVDYIMSFILLF